LAICFLFGVIISPTDAVVAADALKRTPLPESLKSKIVGESLFNDGTAVVLFSLALATAFNLSPTTFFEHTQWLPTLAQWPIYFIWQCIGGILIGTLVGALFLYAISTVNQPTVELLLTLAAATASYVLSEMLFASAPIAVVFAGLAIGYHGRKRAMSDETQSRIFPFWELLDELLNVSLFVLIGIQLVNLGDAPWLIAFGAIPIALISRHFSVAIPIFAARFFKTFPPRATTWMTWGGLRGGISLALAMSVPTFEGTPLLISLTYVVVVFSIVIQGGMIIPYLAKRERLNHDTPSN
jgi:CPA1 family monovalent cation:H+ antiporter